MDSIDMSVETPLDLEALFAEAKTPPTPWPSQSRLDVTKITRRRTSPNSGPAVVVLGLLAVVMSALAVRASTATWRAAREANIAAAVVTTTATPRPTHEATEREMVSPSERRYPDIDAERRHVVEIYLFRQALLAKLRGQ